MLSFEKVLNKSGNFAEKIRMYPARRGSQRVAKIDLQNAVFVFQKMHTRRALKTWNE